MATKKTTAKAQPAATPAEVENPATNTEVADQVTESEESATEILDLEETATDTEVADLVAESDQDMVKISDAVVDILAEVADRDVDSVDPIVAAPDQTDPLVVLAMQYAAYYPNNSAFHITSDRQVFLSGDLSQAQNHQRTLGMGELRTIQF